MLDFLFAMMVASLNSVGDEGRPQQSAQAPAVVVAPTVQQSAEAAVPAPASAPAPQASSSVTIGQGSVVMGEGVIVEGVPAAVAPGVNMAVVPPGLVAEPQVPSGKFLTAMEVKPILNATRGNWVAVREFNGQDLLYVTHLWSWRCGLAAMAISVNDEPMQNWPLPPCHNDTGTPNAIIESDGQPYLTLRLGSVQKVGIQIIYDDLSMDVATFARNEIKMP